MTTVLCYHHKGGVGKTTTAVHVARALLDDGQRGLLVDGDTQKHAARFFGVAAAELMGARAEREDGALTVVGADYPRLRQTAGRAGTGFVVIDLSSDFVTMARVAETLPPDVALVCVKQDQGALRDLESVVNVLIQRTAAAVRVVPIGIEAPEIAASMPRLPAGSYDVEPTLPYVPAEAEASFAERRALWTFPGLGGLRRHYRSLV